jgi:hypothetical protein
VDVAIGFMEFDMKKFYLCKLCLVVFGALLAVQSVSAESNSGTQKNIDRDLQCIAVLHVLRELALQADNLNLLKTITKKEDDIVAAHPRGSFPQERINSVAKTLLEADYDLRIKAQQDCDWKIK